MTKKEMIEALVEETVASYLDNPETAARILGEQYEKKLNAMTAQELRSHYKEEAGDDD